DSRQHCWLGIVINVPLQEFQNVEAVERIRHERREQTVQAIVNGDEVVPVLGTTLEGGLVFLERFAAEVARLERFQDVLVRETRAVQSDADAGREDRIDEARRITDATNATAS